MLLLTPSHDPRIRNRRRRSAWRPSPARQGLVALALVLSLIAVSCSTDSSGDGGGDDPLTIVATTSIWADVAAAVAGDDATVEVLVPRGADPHGYQPSSRDVARLQSADLVIANGLGLEEGLSDVLEAAAAEGVTVVEIAPLLDPLPFVEDGVVGDDPHVWMDPLRVAAGAGVIADSLMAIDPSVPWGDRAEAYAAELAAADDTIVAILDAVPGDRRVMVTNHDAFGYFADRYDFTILGVVIPGGSTLSDPSSAELAALVSDMTDAGVTVIFAETSSPTTLADAVASELGTDVSVVSLVTGSLGAEGSPTATLIGLLSTNAEAIASALSTTSP